MHNIHEIISDNIKNNIPCVVVTIVNKVGSIPQSIGSIMVVESDKIHGTVGGGSLEANCIVKAREILNSDTHKSITYNYNLSKEPFNMICGGSVDIMYSIYNNNDIIHVFGSGHIAKALEKVADNIDLKIIFYDDRKEYLENFKNAVLIDYDNLKLENINSYVVVATRGYIQDFKAVEYVKDLNFKYLGILGSKKKKIELFEKYQLDKKLNIYMPAGLNISNQDPNEIAISIIAEILQLKNELNGGHNNG